MFGPVSSKNNSSCFVYFTLQKMRCHFVFQTDVLMTSPQKAPEQCSEFIKSVVKGMQIKINAEALLTKEEKEKRKNWLKVSFINLCN